jgi:hypothetical protein
LIPEEGIVQFLIIDVDLAHLRLNSLSCLLFQRHGGFFLLDSISLIGDSSIRDPGCGLAATSVSDTFKPMKEKKDVRGSWKGGFSIPRFPDKYSRFADQ